MGFIFSKPLSLRDILLHLDNCTVKQEEKVKKLKYKKSNYTYKVIKILIIFYLPLLFIYLATNSSVSENNINVHYNNTEKKSTLKDNHLYNGKIIKNNNSQLYINFKYFTIVYIFVSIAIIFILRYIFNYRINRNIKILENYKKTQKEKVELFKKQEFYLETKNIIEKYELKNIEGKKRNEGVEKKNIRNRDNVNENRKKDMKSGSFTSFIDRVADVVLQNDPSTMYALICEQCKLHNGLVPLKDDKTTFRCRECNFLNGNVKNKDVDKI
ncbi:hypothetical protein SLOPH_1780 [Spraguea lophii 42_110]|uniref:Endoplasmic reticulum junction formation protein lunapark n=1 Tax=Spraguea lophii (strain 42_110) TaxID=1358809 RepID=S7XTS0_SPRLO|nr:hypothetical protein SLOPH_1780 [Spraguea lophii 42_110]